MMHFSTAARVLVAFATLAVLVAADARPVEFSFRVAGNSHVQNPFERELWAEVITPGGSRVVLPAFHVGRDLYAVRARPTEVGTYRLGLVSEGSSASRRPVEARFTTPGEIQVTSATRMPSVGRDPERPTAFAGSDGRAIFPVGANVAWATGRCVPFYRDAFSKFAAEDLNWMRIWMAHWGELNLDWLAESQGASPRPGTLDPRVAHNWDRVLEMAEENGVYVQMVLQHHGQYSTGVNPNWKINPWNAENPGGFLNSPTEFFTSPRARSITRMKYRYIVARWGWSPAVFAWELFNEVHWVDAIHVARNEAVVAAWHDEMARWLRSVDVYRHLVTTSTDDLHSPSYREMDYFQPHLYAADLLVGARQARVPGGVPDRPVFYGEIGDDHLDVSAAVKKSGVAHVPPAWAGLFGECRLPAQPWLGATIMEQGRTAELGAVQRFITGTGFASQRELAPFSAVVESPTRVPLELAGCQVWQRRPAPEIEVPMDGRVPIAFANIPRIYVGLPISIHDGFPDRATYHIDLPKAVTMRATIAGLGQEHPAGIQFVVDGTVVTGKSWTLDAPDRPTADKPVHVEFPVGAGRHTLVVQNQRGGDWVEVAGLDLGMHTAAITAVGQRNDGFIALWFWNREGVLAMDPPSAAAGTVTIDDVPAGIWQVTPWDTVKGVPGSTDSIRHGGGALRLPISPVARHAALVLRKTGG